MPKKTCAEAACTKQAIAQGFCRQHYDAKYRKGDLQLVAGEPYSTGRPPGPQKAKAMLEDDWQEMEDPGKEAVAALARKRAWKILSDPGSSVAEVTAALKLAWDGDEGKKKSYDEEMAGYYDDSPPPEEPPER